MNTESEQVNTHKTNFESDSDTSDTPNFFSYVLSYYNRETNTEKVVNSFYNKKTADKLFETLTNIKNENIPLYDHIEYKITKVPLIINKDVSIENEADNITTNVITDIVSNTENYSSSNQASNYILENTNDLTDSYLPNNIIYIQVFLMIIGFYIYYTLYCKFLELEKYFI